MCGITFFEEYSNILNTCYWWGRLTAWEALTAWEIGPYFSVVVLPRSRKNPSSLLGGWIGWPETWENCLRWRVRARAQSFVPLTSAADVKKMTGGEIAKPLLKSIANSVAVSREQRASWWLRYVTDFRLWERWSWRESASAEGESKNITLGEGGWGEGTWPSRETGYVQGQNSCPQPYHLREQRRLENSAQVQGGGNAFRDKGWS